MNIWLPLFFLTSVITYSQPKTDILYMKCYSDGSDIYSLPSDMNLMRHYRKMIGSEMKKTVAGKWAFKDSVITFSFNNKNYEERDYKNDSVLTLHFLVGIEMLNDWEEIKLYVNKKLEKDEFYQSLISDPLNNEGKQWTFLSTSSEPEKSKQRIIRQIRFEAFRYNILTKNILIEKPKFPTEKD